jgi:signal transduction histidine kinase
VPASPPLQTGFFASKIRSALFYAAALLVGLSIIFGELAPPQGAQIIASAVFTPDPPAGESPETLPLPHRCRRADDKGGCVGVYRMIFQHDRRQDGPLSVYLPTFSGGIVLSVNGVMLADSRRSQAGAVINQVGPLITLIPDVVLRSGANVLEIHLAGWGRLGGFIDRPAVGPDHALRPAYATREFVYGTLPRLLTAWQAALCLSLLIVWAGRREERMYLAMSGVLGFGVLQGAPLFFTATDWPEWVLRAANMTGIWQATLLPGIMAGLVGRRLPADGRLLSAPPLFLSFVYVVMTFDPATLQPWFAGLWLAVGAPWTVAMLGWAVGIIIVAAFRDGHGAARFIFGTLVVVVMMAGYDLTVFLAPSSESYLALSRFASPLLMTAVSATLMSRFAAALTEVSRFNEVLRREKAAVEAALRASFAREQAQHRAAALESERLRLTRDLHDGLAGQLVSIVAQCALPNRDYQQIGTAARRALDDLRLVVASLDDVGDDLGMVLAQFHERIGPQLQAQGVALDWRMSPLPDIGGLRSEHALSLFRILQEAVTNAVRHSGGDAVAISMAPSERPDYAARIVVSDQGRGGFSDRPGGRGAANMRRRAAAMGADLAIESGPAGTRAIIHLPRVLPDIAE